MRVLYVALTRAKEKLIITGLEKDYKKSIQKKEEFLDSYKDVDGEGKINKNIIKKYISYLEWIELVYLKCGKQLEDVLKVEIHKKQDLLKKLLDKEEMQEINIEDKLEKIDNKHKEEIKKKLEWEYKGKISGNILTKTSVTQIKNMKFNLEEQEKEVEYNIPEFLKKEKKITNAEKGTLMHLIMQKLDISIEYDTNKIEELLNRLEEKHIITNIQKEAVDIEKIYEFTKTNIWKEMKTAKKVERERPFYINVPVKEIYEEDTNENILVQGIIDLYYITDNEGLVLVDYKTDRVKEEAELIQKYKEQLNLYKKALERALDRKVDRVCIYSLFLDKEVNL